MIEIHKPDILIIEDIQLQTYGHGQTQVKTYNTLARLQGVLLDTCFEYDMYCDLVYASEWRRACGIGEGTGREAKKKQAQDKVFTWYGLKCTQDEADAICIGKYCCQGKTKKNTGWGEYIE